MGKSECKEKECCCQCRWQIRLKTCDCNKCPAVVGGFVCIGISEDLGQPDIGVWFPSQHGSCEMFEEREFTICSDCEHRATCTRHPNMIKQCIKDEESKCDCHNHERQVCDKCQKITGKEKDKEK